MQATHAAESGKRVHPTLHPSAEGRESARFVERRALSCYAPHPRPLSSEGEGSAPCIARAADASSAAIDAEVPLSLAERGQG